MKALIVWGGWDGHEPESVAQLLASALRGEGFDVALSDSLDVFRDRGLLAGLSLIVPVWSMGTIEDDQLAGLLAAVEGGVGIGGCHGGMCDSFRQATDYQFMTGGQWVAHPGGDDVEYAVRFVDREHVITRGLDDFPVRSEQYYMHVDPANHVLAVTRFPVADGPHVPNGDVDMPVAWTRRHGRGRVFYCSLGHRRSVLEQEPALELCTRGLVWASGSAS
ncbi:MAG TPA: ThuA domain-containing protein [Gaiellaceae bacterium]